MGMNRLADTGIPRGLATGQKNGLRGDWTVGPATGEEPFRGALPPPVSGEYFAERRRQHVLPVLAALAAANRDDFPAAIDVANFQVRNFRHPQTGSIHGGQNRSVAEVLRSLQQRFDLFLAEDHGKLALVTGKRYPFDVDSAVQGSPVEKAQPGDSLDVRGELESFFIEQI